MNSNHNIALSLILLIVVSANLVYPKNIHASNDNLNLGKSSLMDELINDHGFDEQYVLNIFENMKFLPELIESISRPAKDRR